MTISATDFDFVRTLLLDDSAIAIETGKEYLVEARLGMLARQEGAASIQSLIESARGLQQRGLRYKIIEAMTTNETSFFRDGTPFDALKTRILPELIERRAAEQTLKIWCAASSTGQEPYSLAMLIRDHFPALASWHVVIEATDLSRDAITRAKSGRYTQLEINRGLPATMLLKYFERDGLNWRVKQPIHDMVRFREMNLIGPWSGVERSDIVLMRNVLIYFNVETRKRILGDVRRILRPDGYLVLGSAESTLKVDDHFKRAEATKTSCYTVLP